MDGLSFTAEMVKAAAWPVAVVAMVLIFRQPLRALLTRLNKGRLGPAEFEFEQQLQVLAARWASTDGGARPGAAVTATATGCAREAILLAWRDLEQVAQGQAQQLPAQDLMLYRQLGALRDQVSQGLNFSPAPDAVRDYVQLARGLRERIERARSDRANVA